MGTQQSETCFIAPDVALCLGLADARDLMTSCQKLVFKLRLSMTQLETTALNARSCAIEVSEVA